MTSAELRLALERALDLTPSLHRPSLILGYARFSAGSSSEIARIVEQYERALIDAGEGAEVTRGRARAADLRAAVRIVRAT